MTSPSPEVSIIARIAAADIQTTTGANNRLIVELTGLDPRTAKPHQVREKLRANETVPTEVQMEKVWLLLELLDEPGLTVLLNYICVQ